MSDDSPPSLGAYPPPPPPPPAAPPPEPPEAPKQPYRLRTRDKVIAFSIGGLVLIGIIAAAVGGAGDEDDTATGTTEETVTTEPETMEPETTEAPTTTAAPETNAASAGMMLHGQGQQSTDPFQLDGGRYAVHYKFDGGCYYSASLEPTDPDVFLMAELGTGTGPVEGDTNAYNVEPGEYYVQVITGPAPDCPWTITLTAAS